MTGLTAGAVYGAAVVVEPRPSRFEPRHIYIGTAEPWRIEQCAGGASVVLSHKLSPYRCTTEVVSRQSDDEIERWREALGLREAEASSLEGVTVVVEDASPDTCLALAALMRRFRSENLPGPWVDYVARWEAGDVHSTGAPECSFGALESALVHPHFDLDDPALLRESLVKGVAYAETLLSAGADPGRVPPDLPFAIHAEARTRLSEERDRYRQILRSATIVQLSLPIRGTARRSIIDAVLLSEIEPTGAIKAWLRRDDSSPSGRGFGLMALYRPRLAGTGNDMTVSVDPTAGVHLRDLWFELERREEAAWTSAKVARPRDEPRELRVYADLEHYPAAPSNQPWYDGGDLTLVAAPRALSVGGPLGTRLEWLDLVDALWSQYRPDAEVRATRRTTEGERPLLDMAAAAAQLDELAPTSLSIANLVRTTDRPAVWTPTLEATLAACLTGQVPGVDRLPSASDFDVFHERGGLVIVSSDGVILFEERAGLGFPHAALVSSATENADVLARALDLESRLREATDRALRAVEVGDGLHVRRALTFVYRMQMNARAHLGVRAAAAADPLVARVAEAMRSRWGSERRFVAVMEQVNALAEMVTTATEARSASLLRRLTIYGFPALVLGALVGDIFLPMSDRSASGVVLGVAGAALAVYAILMAVLTWASYMASSRTDSAWARDLTAPIVLGRPENGGSQRVNE